MRSGSRHRPERRSRPGARSGCPAWCPTSVGTSRRASAHAPRTAPLSPALMGAAAAPILVGARRATCRAVPPNRPPPTPRRRRRPPRPSPPPAAVPERGAAHADPRDEPVPDPARLRWSGSCCSTTFVAVDRRRRHLAHADGRPRDRRPRPPDGRARSRSSARAATWTDQQWLAQLVFYGAHELAGIRGVVLLGMALVLLALVARHRDRPHERRVVALDLPDRLPRRARRPVGLDDPRADGRPPALRRRPLAPRRR